MGKTKSHKCSPNCIYFPNHTLQNEDFEIRENGVKYGKSKPLCEFDYHNILNWEECPNFTAIEKKSVKIPKSEDKMIIICGKSAAGKDCLMNHLVDNYDFNNIISCTTRPKRNKEKDGQDYYFISDEQFQKKIENNEFVEYRKYITLLNNKKDTWYYGIDSKEIENKKKKICVIDTTGVKSIIDYYDRKNIIVIYLKVDDDIREERAKLRGSFSQEEWDRRLKDDDIIFNYDFINTYADWKIDNNNDKEYMFNTVVQLLKWEGMIK